MKGGERHAELANPNINFIVIIFILMKGIWKLFNSVFVGNNGLKIELH